MQYACVSIVSFLETIDLFVPNVKTKGRKEERKGGREKRERKRKKATWQSVEQNEQTRCWQQGACGIAD